MASEYDKLGRLIRSQRLLENRPTAEWETTLYGYDGLGRSVKIIKVASNPTYNMAADPALNSYSASSNPGQDIVTRTAYDKLERVMWTEDPFGSKTWMGYDGLSRLVKQVVNAVGTASDGSANDPRSASYVPSSLADRDLVTITTYNADGRVLSTQDVLGRVTRMVYDTVGRVIRTVQNFVDQAEDPALWVYTGASWKKSNGTTAINHGADNDQNQVTRTVFDGQGRASERIDHRTNRSLMIYDDLDRPTMTIANYIVQGSSQPQNWVWSSSNNRWEDGAGNAISFDTDMDRNRITTTLYDLLGRVLRVRTPDGRESRNELDAMGRRYRSIVNYVDGVFNSAQPDQDLITTTTFYKTGAEYSVTDARGTQTRFDRDKRMRPQRVTRAAGNPLATVMFNAFDKAGRVWRTVENWSQPSGQPWPDNKDASGNWGWIPSSNGLNNDTDLTMDYRFDQSSRVTRRIINYRVQGTTNPINWVWSSANNRWEDGAGNPLSHGANNDQNLIQLTSFYKDGQVEGLTDAAGVMTKTRYDLLRRPTRTVQSYVVQGASDPANWVWETNAWKQAAGGTVIAHGTNNDQNLIQVSTLDKAGRTLNQRDPRGNLTTFVTDLLNRRKSLTNPLGKVWSNTYFDYSIGGIRVEMTYPGITGNLNYVVERKLDRLGRLRQMSHGNPSKTPSIGVFYDAAGNRQKMTEYSGSGYTTPIRETTFSYDAVNRMTAANVDADANGTVDQTVSYQYDAGGLRTRMTLLGGLQINYSYDARGRLQSLTDWDNQTSQFGYDLEDRHLTTDRPGLIQTQHQYDSAGRLRSIRHRKTSGPALTHAAFDYRYDRLGNRVEAQEVLANPATTTDTIIAATDKGLALTGTWADVSGFKESIQTTATLKLLFLANTATLTMGRGPDHSQYDLYLNGAFWQTVDGYAATASQVDITLPTATLVNEGPHLLEIRNKNSKNASSTGFKLRFKQLLVVDKTWTLHSVEYSYDRLSRLLEARYNPGVNTAAVDADLLRRYQYSYDRQHNRLSESVALNGAAPTVKNWTYNAANQISNAGYSYDDNGNLLGDGLTTYTWDRANRLRAVGTTTYQHFYDGDGRRHRQAIGATTTDYLFDVNRSLATVVAETTGASVIRNIHGPQGVHALEDASGNWEYPLPDALDSLRVLVNSSAGVLESRNFDPYGSLFSATGTPQTDYGFTGERTDGHGLLDLRARRYSPALGQFMSLDPLETFNRYGYVDGNVINRVDPSGLLMMFRRSRYDDDAPVRKVVVTPPAAPKAWKPVQVSSWKPSPFKPSALASSSSSGSVKGAGFTQSHVGVSVPSSSGKLQKSPSSASSPTGTGMRSMGSSSSASSPTGKGMGSSRSTSLVSPSTGTGVRSLRSPSDNSGGSFYSVDRMRQALQGTSRRGSNSPLRLTSGDSGGLLPEPCGTDVLCLTPSPDFGTSVSPGDFALIPGGTITDLGGILRSGGRSQWQEFPGILIPEVPQPWDDDDDSSMLLIPEVPYGLLQTRSELEDCKERCKDEVVRAYELCMDGCRGRTGYDFVRCRNRCGQLLAQYTMKCEAKCEELYG
jgi:RHS repeat-associated protein